nr:uncharacterized protein LOC127302698 isoform X2 [Lolium perenne]
MDDQTFLAASDGVDRMSSLPHEIRCRIVSCLPMREAARTAALSSRWRNIWRLLLINKLSPPSAMDGRRQFTNMEPSAQADLRRKSCDPPALAASDDVLVAKISPFTNMEPAAEADLRRKSCEPPVLAASDDVLVAKLSPFTNLDPAAEADLRRKGSDPPVLAPSDDDLVTKLSPFTNLDPESAAHLRRKGCDPHKVDQATEYTLRNIYSNLPKFPVDDARRLPPVLASTDGVDHMSRLSCQLRREIVSRLPIKDAARTAVLSTLWRAIWLSTPLILMDAHLLPERQGICPTPAAIIAAVSSILEAHPGPFRCVHLICCNMNSCLPQLARWLQLLAAKGVQELVLVNHKWLHQVPLPATFFSITTLTRLYLGQWKLPHISALRGVLFPELRELGICCVRMDHHREADYLIARCIKLEILNILGVVEGLRLHLVSPTLRCVQICFSMMDDFAVVKAPRLERLVLYRCRAPRGFCTRVRIGDAPRLNSFGFLEPGQLLQIQNTVIVPGMKVSTRSIVSSVKVLSLTVRFGVHNSVKMVPAFLKCFPNVERLHIMSEKCDKPSRYLNRKFWEMSGPIENVASCIKVMSLREFRGEPSGVGFLEFFFQRARVLEVATIVLANSKLTPFPKDEVVSKVREILKKRVSKVSSEVDVLESNGPEGGKPWNFQKGADLSCHDPFSVA